MSMSRYLLYKPQPEARVRFYGFCHAGGNSSIFLPWQHALGPAVEVCGVQLPGRGWRISHPPERNMSVLVNAIVRDLQLQSALPFVFFGHSLGALIAFEVARALKLLHLPQPMHLWVSGCDAPQSRQPSRRLHELDDAALIEALAHYGGTPREVLAHRELMQIALPSIRADFALAADYSYLPMPSLDTPITVFTGAADEHVNQDNIAHWSRETTGAFGLECFPGDHFFIESDGEQVVSSIRKHLHELIQAY